MFPTIEYGKPVKLKEQRTDADSESNDAGIFVSPKLETILCPGNPTTFLQTRIRHTEKTEELVTLSRSTRYTHTHTHTHTHICIYIYIYIYIKS